MFLTDNFATSQTSGSTLTSGTWTPAGYRDLQAGASISSNSLTMPAGSSVEYGLLSGNVNMSGLKVVATGVSDTTAVAQLQLILVDNLARSGFEYPSNIVGNTAEWNLTVGSYTTISTTNITSFFFANQSSNPITITGLNSVVACFGKGCQLLTSEDIYLPIEDVKVGTILKTVDGVTSVKQVQRSVCPPYEQYLPYLIPKDSLGENIPNKDTILSPGHAVCINGEWKHMFHSQFQRVPFGTEVEYFHVATDSFKKDKIYVNGIISETWDRDGELVSWECDSNKCVKIFK